MAGQQGLTREFLAERDLRIFKMRQAGVASNEIARRFGLSTGAVNSAIRRQLEKLNREALMAYPEVLRLELERLDALQQAIWPLTQHRKVTLDDGTEVTLEPDLRAVQQVLSVMDRRARLLGMEQTNINVMVDAGDSMQRAVLAGSIEQALDKDAFSPETEARQLLEVMAAAGVIPEETARTLIGATALPEIVDAELIEEDEE
jgi:hypothetical protein